MVNCNISFSWLKTIQQKNMHAPIWWRIRISLVYKIKLIKDSKKPDFKWKLTNNHLFVSLNKETNHQLCFKVHNLISCGLIPHISFKTFSLYRENLDIKDDFLLTKLSFISRVDCTKDFLWTELQSYCVESTEEKISLSAVWL